MKKISFFLLIFLLCFFSKAQPKYIYGTVSEPAGIFPIKNAVIHNLNTNQYVFADQEGCFRIMASLHDSLMFSHAGFRQTVVVIDERDYSRARKDVQLFEKSFMLPNVTIYGLNPTYEGFKRDVASAKLPDSYKNLESVHLTKEDRRNATYTEEAPNVLKNTKLGSPITAIYNALSKKVKQRELAEEMQSYGEEVEQVQNKYNKELVSRITGLSDPDLMEFMVFCRFSYYDLVRWSREQIVGAIKFKYDEYQYYKALEDEDE